MGKLRACWVVAVCALSAACGDDGGSSTKVDAAVPDAAPDAKVFMDAPPAMFDFTCSANPEPTTATAQVTLSGTVTKVVISNLQPAFEALEGGDLKACLAGTDCADENELATATSAANGTYSLGPIDTNETPLDAYVAMTEETSRTTYTYPAQPFTADQGNIPVLTFAPELIGLLGFAGDCDQNDADNGIVGIAVTDCANEPITDSTNIEITVKQNGTAVSGVQVNDLGDLSPMAAGTFLLCNVPEAEAIEVGGTFMGMPLRAHNVHVVAGATTATILRPGY